MIEYVNTSEQSLAVNESYSFPERVFRTNCLITPEDTNFIISKTGYYIIHFEATVEAVTAGEVSAQLYVNGEAVPYTKVTATADASGDLVPLSFTGIVLVKPSCCAVNNTKNISIRNVGLAAETTNAKIIIHRIQER